MRKKNYKGRCEKRTLGKCRGICKNYDAIQSRYADINAWENDKEKIMQMDKKTIELWKLLMEVPYAPFFRLPHKEDLDLIFKDRHKDIARLDKKYKLYDYVEIWGNHQWLYNFLRAKHCLLTLQGLKSVDVAKHEWVSHVRPGNPPHKEIWTYNGKEDLAKSIREYGKRPIGM